MRVFFSAGEASGDAYAAALLREMRAQVAIPASTAERLTAVKGAFKHLELQLRPRSFVRTVEYGAVKLDDAPELLRAVHLINDRLGLVLHTPCLEDERVIDQTVDQLLSEVADQPQVLEELLRYATIWPEGVGGKQLDATGASLVARSDKWGAISILQALRVAPKVSGGYSRAKHALRRGKPGLFIPVDFGYVNVKLSRYAKEKGWKVLYFIPPGSWRRHKQGKDLPKVTDEIVTPFPWSADILRAMGASVHFFGHPLKQMIAEREPYRGERTTIAVLPGSRMHEIKENLPVIAEAVSARLGVITGGAEPHGCFDNATPGHPGLQHTVEFAVASSVDVEDLRRRWLELAPDRTGDRFTQGDTYGVLSRARAAIVCSGTATLEAALCRCPHVVMYRFGKMTEIEIRLRRVRPKHISLPNILLDRDVVPELIQQQATPDQIRKQLNYLLADGEGRDRQLKAFEEIDAILGPADAITKTAQLALALGSAQP